MVMSIYPNGYGSRKGTHLSLFVHILRGEFDDKLRWPFDGEVTIQAYNRTTQQWSMERTLVLNERECGLDVVRRRVDARAVVSWGCDDFLSLSELNKDYVKDTNAVRFRTVNVNVCS